MKEQEEEKLKKLEAFYIKHLLHFQVMNRWVLIVFEKLMSKFLIKCEIVVIRIIMLLTFPHPLGLV